MLFETCFGVIPLRKKENVWQVFLVKLKSGNHWGFPKGHPEENEDPFQCALREFFEETHLTYIRFLQREPFLEKYQCEKNGQKVSKQVSYYLILAQGEPHLKSGEILDGKWVNLDEAKTIITYEQSKKICKQVQERMKE